MDAFNELDQESIYTRFFQNKKSLTDTELKRVTEPDFENDVVLVVTTGPEGAETIIGGGTICCLCFPKGHTMCRGSVYRRRRLPRTWDSQ